MMDSQVQRRRFRSVAPLFLACCQAASCMTGASGRDDNATSCAPSFGFGVDPNLATVIPTFVTVSVGLVTVSVGQSAQIDACFYRDRQRPGDRQAITWTTLDTSIATVSPATGPQ